MQPIRTDPPPDPLNLLTSHRRQIVERARRIGRRQGLPEHELDDFASEVMVKLIEHDYAALRAFHGRSRLLTYVSTLILNLARDERNRRWGKWHPAAEAQRLGLEGMELELLLYRDGHTFADAERILRERHPRMRSTDLEHLAMRLPTREQRRFTTDAELETLPAAERSDDRDVARERNGRKFRVLALLRRALSALEPIWQLVIHLRYAHGLKAAEIGHDLGLTSREVYRILEHAKQQLRRGLESQGIDAQTALADLGWDLDGADRHDGAPEPQPNSARIRCSSCAMGCTTSSSAQ